MGTEAVNDTFFIVALNWTGITQLVLMLGVLAYGVWHLLNKKPFNLLIMIFWIVCGYLALALILIAAGFFYRGEAMGDLTFAVSNFMQWAMTVVLFGFLPLTLLAAWANKVSGGGMPGDEGRRGGPSDGPGQ